MKKLLGFPLMVAMVLNFSATVFAAEESSSVDSYNKVLAEINEEYGQEIGIESVDTSQVSIMEQFRVEELHLRMYTYIQSFIMIHKY